VSGVSGEVIVYASISTWEYGCCGDVPQPGAHIDGTLEAFPARNGDRFAPTSQFTWNRELELVQFAGWSARWNPSDGDPTAQPIDVYLSWHPFSELLTPTVTGTVVTAHEIRNAPDGTGGYTYTQVDTLPRFPDMHGTTPESVIGVMVGFVPDSFSEPTADDLALAHADAERGTRTVQLTGPAAAFGATVPHAYSRLTIDLDAADLERTGAGSRASGVVSGDTGQVSRVLTDDRSDSYRGFRPAPEGTSTDGLDETLYVVLTIDSEHF
jgi:hypothetical protein